MRNLSDLTLFLLLAIVAAACQQSTVLGEGLIDEDNTQVQDIDTLKVLTSTLLLDSIYTTNTSRLLTGGFDDPYLGQVNAQCFFNLDSVDVFSIDDDDNLLFDSLSMSLRFDYAYPNTDHLQNLAVFTLLEKLDDETYYFNNSAGTAKLEQVARATFSTRFTKGKRFNIRLDDVLGKALFNVAKNADNFNISDVLKGMSIAQAGSTSGQSVMGFPSDSLNLRIYYHHRSTKEEGSVKLSLKPALRFNQISSDRSQTALKDLKQRGVFLPSTKTNGETYIQAGVGICTAVEFPTLRSIRQNRKLAINVAYLDIQPTKTSYQGSDFAPLENIYVYTPTHKNTLRQPYWAGNSLNPVSVYRVVDPLTGNSKYRIYLTDYINDIINQDSDEYDGILLYTEASSTGISELGRLVIGDQRHPQNAARLHVIFTVIK